MKTLSREQISQVFRTYKYNFQVNKQANMLSLRSVVEQIKTQDQKISVSYIANIYEIVISCRPGAIKDAEAYLSTLSDEDIAKGHFPHFERETVQAIANQTIDTPRVRIDPPAPASSFTPLRTRPKADFSHLPSGHQTLLGVGNVIGNGISLAFMLLMVVIAIAAISSIFE